MGVERGGGLSDPEKAMYLLSITALIQTSNADCTSVLCFTLVHVSLGKHFAEKKATTCEGFLEREQTDSNRDAGENTSMMGQVMLVKTQKHNKAPLTLL